MELVICFSKGSQLGDAERKIAENCANTISPHILNQLDIDELTSTVGISTEGEFIALYGEVPESKVSGIRETLSGIVPLLVGIDQPEIYVGLASAHV